MYRTGVLGRIVAAALCWLLVACSGSQAGGELSPAAEGVTRRDTHTIERYEREGLLAARLSHTWKGRMPDGYTFKTHRFQDDRVTDLTFEWAGAGRCELRSQERVDCWGEVTQLDITYRLEYTPVAQGPYLYYVARHDDSTHPGYSLDLFFPRQFEVLTTTVPPAVQDRGHLSWVQPEMRRFEAQITFEDRGGGWAGWLWVAGAVVLVGAVGLAAAIWLRRRRARVPTAAQPVPRP